MEHDISDSYLVEYIGKVLSGEIVAGESIKKVCRRLKHDIENPGRFHFDVDAAQRPIEFIESWCCYPTGKLGQTFVLELYERAWVESIFGFVDERGYRRFHEVLICVGRKNGKALSLDTEIPTPSGWKTMADVHVGDYVFGVDGKPARVVVESEIFDKPMYLVRFEDGAEVKASADHVWTVKTKSSKRRGDTWFETTTEEMSKDFFRVRADGKGREYKYRVPMAAPVEYAERELPLHPYVLGAWLGDGTSSKPDITVGKQDYDETCAKFAELGWPLHEKLYKSNEGKAPILQIGPSGIKGVAGSNQFINRLRQLDVFENKHIPEEYMLASIDQRMHLLQGIMDTDGTCSKSNGQCEFTQKSRLLAEQVVELCSSLGIKASMKPKEAMCYGVPAGTVYRVLFFTDKSRPCFTLRRKAERLKDRLSERMGAKSVVSIERIPNEPSKCIGVDSEDHLYLFGRQYTATHNTSLVSAIEAYMSIADHEGAPQIYNAANSLDQARLGYDAFKRIVAQSPQLGRVFHNSTDRIKITTNLGFVKPLPAKPATMDGFDVHLGILDEIHAAADGAVWELLKQGTSARTQPLILMVTTNGFLREGFFDQRSAFAHAWLDGTVEDERYLTWFYELDDQDAWDDPSVWMKANPGLGTVKRLDYMEEQVARAKVDAPYLPTVLCKDLNRPANASIAWLTYDEAVNVETFDLDSMGFTYGIAGFDAADNVDLAAACMLLMRPGDEKIYRVGMAWLPEDVVAMNIADHDGGRDNVPYHIWKANGLLRTVPGHTVPKSVFTDWLIEMRDEHGIYTFACGYDPWHVQDDHTRGNINMIVGETHVFPIRQGPQTLSQWMYQIKEDYKHNVIVDNHSPINEWCRMNVQIRTDENRNIAPMKKGNDPRHRIDCWAAELDAYVVLNKLKDEYLAYIS